MKIEIEIKKRTAKVRLPNRVFRKRTNGLIQFLSEFCSHIQYDIYDGRERLSPSAEGRSNTPKKTEQKSMEDK